MRSTPSWCEGLASNYQPCNCVSYQGCDSGYPVTWCEYNADHQAAAQRRPHALELLLAVLDRACRRRRPGGIDMRHFIRSVPCLAAIALAAVGCGSSSPRTTGTGGTGGGAAGEAGRGGSGSGTAGTNATAGTTGHGRLGRRQQRRQRHHGRTRRHQHERTRRQLHGRTRRRQRGQRWNDRHAGGSGNIDAGAGGPCTVGAWPAADPSVPGPFATVTENNVGPAAGVGVDGGAAPMFTLFRPMDLAQGGLCHPVITWGNGTGSTPSLYKVLLNHLASHGFVVIASNSTNVAKGNPAPMLAGVTWVLGQNDDPSSACTSGSTRRTSARRDTRRAASRRRRRRRPAHH